MTNPEITENGAKCWYNEQGELHREDGGPAIEYSDGTKCWYLNGKLHRIGSPAVLYNDEDREWWVNGQRHRIGGPAFESSTGHSAATIHVSKEWWINGKLHRLDGPAVIKSDDAEIWFVNGKKIDIQPILERLDISPDWKSWTDVEKMIVRLAL